MLPAQIVLILVTVFMGFTLGLTANIWIIIIHFRDWKNGKQLQPCDQIHVSMGLVNVLLLCTMAAHGLLYTLFFSVLLVAEMFFTFFVVLQFLVYFSFWLNACLCGHYVISLAGFTRRPFVWLKSHLSAIMPKLILVLAVGSLAISLMFVLNIHLKSHLETNGDTAANSTLLYVNPAYRMGITSLGCFLPFTLSVLCIAHTLTSLLRHVWRVKHNDSGSSRPSLRAHVRAAVTMILLVILYLSFQLSQVFSLLTSLTSFNAISMLSWFFIVLFPAAQSFVVIQANSKLRKEFQGKLCVGKQWVTQVCLTIQG